MARGYLGKISAIVTANTTDLERKLRAGKGEVDSFGKSIRSTFVSSNRAAAQSFNQIFTAFQRLERAIQFANRNPLALNIKPGEIDRARALASAAQLVAKPLADLQKRSEQLSLPIRSALQPVLVQAQEAAKNAENAIDRIGSRATAAFERARASVQAFNAAQREAEALQSRLGSLGSGRQLASQPILAQIDRAREAQAAALTAAGTTGVVNPGVATAIDRQTTAAERAAEAFVKLQSAQATGQRDVAGLKASYDRLLASLIAATAAVERQTAAAANPAGPLIARARAEIEFEEESSRLRAVAAADAEESSRRQAVAAANAAAALSVRARAEIEFYEESSRLLAARAADLSRLEAREFTITGQVQNFDQARQEANRLLNQVGQLPSGRSAFDARLTQLDDLIDANDVAKLDLVREIIGDIQNSLAERRRLDVIDEQQVRAAQELARQIQSLRQNADFVITGRPQNFDQVRSELSRIEGQIGNLDEAQRNALRGRITAVIDAIGLEKLDAAVESLELLRSEASGVIEVNVNATAAERRIRSLVETWDYAVRQIPNSTEQLDRQFRQLEARIGRLDLEGRNELDPLIRGFVESARAADPLIAQFQRLLELQSRLEEIESRPPPVFGPPRPPAPPPVFGPPAPGLSSPILTGPRGLQVSDLRSQVADVESALQQLPRSVQQQFRPQLQAARDTLEQISRSPDAFRAGVAAARREVEGLAAAARQAGAAVQFRQRFGGAGASGINFGINERAVSGLGAQIELLQSRLTRFSDEARGPAVAAINRWRNAVSRALADGSFGTEQGQRKLEGYRQAVIRVVASLEGVRPSRLARDLQRVGDVGRGAFGNVGLAVQQAAFAVDDFFSVTGGLDQRIRAAGNNLSQLGFILGGTAGLFAGLAVSIGSQAAVALLKFINNGRTSEIVTKSLNDALARQQSIVESLSKAFEQLSGTFLAEAFTEATKRADDFSESLDEIRKKLADIREGRIFGADQRVVNARADVAVAENRVQQATTRDELLNAQRELELARRRLRDAENRARQLPDETVGTARSRARDVLRRTAARQAFGAGAAAGAAGGGSASAGASAAQAAEAARRDAEERVARLNRIDDPLRLRNALQSEADRLRRAGESSAAADLEAIIISLEDPIRRAGDELSASILESSRPVGLALQTLQSQIDQATQDGVIGLSPLSQEIERTADRIKEAGRELDRITNDLSTGILSEEEANKQRNAIRESLRDLPTSVDLADRADELRRRQAFDEERLAPSILSRIEQTTQRLGDPAAALERRRREIEQDIITNRNQLAAAPADPVLIQAQENLVAQLRALEIEVSTLDETLNGFEARERNRLRGDPERGRTLGMSEADQAAEQVQQGLNDIAARFGELAAEGSGLVDQEGQRAATEQFLTDQRRRLAPLLSQLDDEVANAVAQGPSRAALQASDVSTTQGQAELNRLIRGDDPARDINLQELRRQTELLARIEQKTFTPGLADD